MAKYILASDFYVNGVGHFKRSHGPFDWREIPDHIVVPKTAKRLHSAPDKPVEETPAIPALVGRKPETLEDILRRKTAAPAADPRDEELAKLRQQVKEMQKAPEPAPDAKADDEPKSAPAVDPELAKLVASRDTNTQTGRMSGGKAPK